MKQTIFSYSFQGFSHIKRELDSDNQGRKFPCQDRCFGGHFDKSDNKKIDSIKLFVKNQNNENTEVQLPVLLNPHNSEFSVVCVADGHGGAPYFRSEKGAEFAIQVAVELLSESIDKISDLLLQKDYLKINKNLSKSFVKRWYRKILDDLYGIKDIYFETEFANLKKENGDAADIYEQDILHARELAEKYKGLLKNPISEIEENPDIEQTLNDFSKLSIKSIYGCTIAVYFELKDSPLWYGFKVGDSDILASFNGNFEKPIKDDDKCFLNETTSLCNDNAFDLFCFPELKYLECRPETILCSTDGIANSFENEDFHKKFYSQLQFLFDEEGCKNALDGIKEHIPLLGERGSGDDISLAGIVRFDDTELGKNKRRILLNKKLRESFVDRDFEKIDFLLKNYLDNGDFNAVLKKAYYDCRKTEYFLKNNKLKDFEEAWDFTNKELKHIETESQDLETKIKILGWGKFLDKLQILFKDIKIKNIQVDNKNF